MKIIKGFISGVVFFFAVSIIFSCNLDDFNLKKLANPDDIVPEVFSPLAYGTFKVRDLVTAGSLADNFPIPSNGLELDSVILNKKGTSFTNSAIDSVYLITHFTNNTTVDIEFNMSFTDTLTGISFGKVFMSGKIPPGTTDQEIQFPLGIDDQENLRKASDISIVFKISSPDAANPILYKAIKNTTFAVKISFYAPLNLRKL
jgi:hypothetical protein